MVVQGLVQLCLCPERDYPRGQQQWSLRFMGPEGGVGQEA